MMEMSYDSPFFTTGGNKNMGESKNKTGIEHATINGKTDPDSQKIRICLNI
jgi:hypothetical protein